MKSLPPCPGLVRGDEGRGTSVVVHAQGVASPSGATPVLRPPRLATVRDARRWRRRGQRHIAPGSVTRRRCPRLPQLRAARLATFGPRSNGGSAAVSHRELTTVRTTTMTTVGLPDTLTYATVELASCLVTPSARAYGSKGRLAARRQPTDQYDGALDTTGDHIGAPQWHWPTSPGTSNQRSGRRGRRPRGSPGPPWLPRTLEAKALILSVARRPRQSHHNIVTFVEYRSGYRSASRLHQRQPTQ
jgi:hypothetical protein